MSRVLGGGLIVSGDGGAASLWEKIGATDDVQLVDAGDVYVAHGNAFASFDSGGNARTLAEMTVNAAGGQIVTYGDGAASGVWVNVPNNSGHFLAGFQVRNVVDGGKYIHAQTTNGAEALILGEAGGSTGGPNTIRIYGRPNSATVQMLVNDTGRSFYVASTNPSAYQVTHGNNVDAYSHAFQGAEVDTTALDLVTADIEMENANALSGLDTGGGRRDLAKVTAADLASFGGDDLDTQIAAKDTATVAIASGEQYALAAGALNVVSNTAWGITRTAHATGAGTDTTYGGQDADAGSGGDGGDIEQAVGRGDGAGLHGTVKVDRTQAVPPGGAVPGAVADYEGARLPAYWGGVALEAGALQEFPSTTPATLTQGWNRYLGGRGDADGSPGVPRVRIGTTGGLWLVEYSITFEAVDPATFTFAADYGTGTETRGYASATVAAGDVATVSSFAVFRYDGANTEIRIQMSSDVGGGGAEISILQGALRASRIA